MHQQQNTHQCAGVLAEGSHGSKHVLLLDCNNPRAVLGNIAVLQSTHYKKLCCHNGSPIIYSAYDSKSKKTKHGAACSRNTCIHERSRCLMPSCTRHAALQLSTGQPAGCCSSLSTGKCDSAQFCHAMPTSITKVGPQAHRLRSQTRLM
jgi:hypothetical protein